jgi:hypothetical protein
VKKPLLVLAVSMAIGLGASFASAATRCNPVLSPGENLARVAANCPPSTTFTIKDGTYKLVRAVNANSGDTFKGVYSDGTRPKIDLGLMSQVGAIPEPEHSVEANPT